MNMKWCDYCRMPIEQGEEARTLAVRSPINEHGFALLDITGEQPHLHVECRANLVVLLAGKVTK